MMCPKCMSSFIVKEGTRKRKHGTVQEYSCNACSKWFSTAIDPDGDAGTSSLLPEDIIPGGILEYKTQEAFRLHCATDIHHGANEHDWEKFEEFIDEVDSDPKARWIMNGDNIELIPPNYKISQRGQSMEPDDPRIHPYKR